MAKFSEYVKTENIRNARINKGLTVGDISRRMGFSSRVSYYNIENGVVEPKVSQIVTLSNILDGPVQEFFNI